MHGEAKLKVKCPRWEMMSVVARDVRVKSLPMMCTIKTKYESDWLLTISRLKATGSQKSNL